MARRPEITMRVVEETTSAEASRRPGIPVIPEKPLLDPGIGSHPPLRFGGKRGLILSMLGLAVLAAVLTWPMCLGQRRLYSNSLALNGAESTRPSLPQ